MTRHPDIHDQHQDHFHPTHPAVAKWCIWSVKNQSWLSGQIRIYIWGATAVVAFFTFVGFIALETALWSLFFSGAVIATSIWLLIRQRKVWLLNIQDPQLRRQALEAMVGYLVEIEHEVPYHSQHRQVHGNGHGKSSDYSRLG